MAAGGMGTAQAISMPRQVSKTEAYTQRALYMQQRRSKSRRPQDPDRNIVSWALAGEYYRAKKVLIDADHKERFVSLRRATDLVASLTGAFEPYSTVCLHLPNDILYPVLCLAIFSSKCRWTGTNPSYKASELKHHFEISSTRYVIVDSDHLRVVEEAVEKSGTVAEIILFGDLLKKSDNCCQAAQIPRKYRCLHDLQQERSEQEFWEAIEDIKPESIATLASTSGTTGPPKMAARTHRAIVFESKAMVDTASAKPYRVKRLFSTPIFHAFSMPDMVINPLRLGIPSYFTRRFRVEEFTGMVQEFGITETFAPPAMILMLANEPACAGKIQSLRQVYTGGAPFTEELRNKFDRLFPSSRPPVIAPVWGMTEAGWITTLKWSEQEVTSSVGRCPPGYKIKYGQSFEALENGQELFELLVRSEGLMSRYWANAKATEDAFVDGWLKTGDVGYVEDGKVFLIDRIKDLIKCNAWQISPTELGDVLLKSPQVNDAAVVGAGFAVDEHPVAFVVRAARHSDVSAETLKGHMLQHLVKYKVEKCEIRFLDAIPKNGTGKVDRKVLKRLAEEP